MWLDLESLPRPGDGTSLLGTQKRSVKQEPEIVEIPERDYEVRGCTSLTPWEHGVSKLRQRVQEVQALIAEDLQDLRDPLDFLMKQRILTHEQALQRDHATAIYEHLCQHSPGALDALLAPFESCEMDAGAANSVVVSDKERRREGYRA